MDVSKPTASLARMKPIPRVERPLALMLCADRVPIVSAHFKSTMTQTGSPDPRIDLVCTTLSCPRQFLQNFGTPSSLPGLLLELLWL
jgi:hypothetical protein